MKSILRKIFESVLHLDLGKISLDGKKKYLGVLLYLATVFIPGFPVIDIAEGITADQFLMLWGVISDLYKKALKK